MTPQEATARTVTDHPDSDFRAKIDGMDCGSCAVTIEDGLRKLPGVRQVSVSFTTESLRIEGDISRAEVERRLGQLGYRLADARDSGAARDLPGTGATHDSLDPGANTASAPTSTGGSSPGAEPANVPRNFINFLTTQPQQRLALAAGVATLFATAIANLTQSPVGRTAQWWVLVATIVVVGAPIFAKGLRALIFSHRVTIDLLMTLAALGAMLIGETGEAAIVVLLFTIGEGLEGFSASRARDSLRSLMALQPQTATVLRKHEANADAGANGDHDHDQGHAHTSECDAHDGHNHEHGGADSTHSSEPHDHTATVAVEELAPGDRILVRPGERIAADGVVISGASSVNQAAVTGESIPVTKTVGDPVMAGTINAEGALEVEVTRRSSDSTVARIARLVEQAQAKRSTAERFMDRFARWYTPAVVALAMITVAIPVLFFSQPLLDTLDGAHGWLYRGLALLIVACPCALVISIPVTVVSSLTRLARLGVLVKGGEQLDRLAEIRTIAFDKTGTLTSGRPSVTAIQARGCIHEVQPEPACGGCDDVIALAASVERSSEHPIAHAIMESAQSRGLGSRYPAAADITAIAGQGVIGMFRGSKLAVGSDVLLGNQGAQANLAEFQTLRESNRTVMTVALGAEVVGAIGVEDEIRAETRATLDELHRSNPPIRTVMLTGDNLRVAEDIARKIGAIDEVRADLPPADKSAAIRQLQNDYGRVAMVGDGINDAPALASADVGIAMGGAGSAQAMETADVVLMQDDLRRVPMALRLARCNRSVIQQNIVLSLGLKLAFLALIIPGWATLWLAVATDVGATVLVTLNGMRMLRQK